MHAFVVDNKIVSLSTGTQSGVWIPCADDAQIGSYFDESILTLAQKTEFIQKKIDDIAKEKDFGDGISCATYSTSTNELWQSQALAFIAWRDAVWVYSYTEFDKMSNGQRPVPTIEEFLTELPVMNWPN